MIRKNPVLTCQTFDIFIIKLVSNSPSNETLLKVIEDSLYLKLLVNNCFLDSLECRSCLVVGCPYVEVIPAPVTHWKLVEQS